MKISLIFFSLLVLSCHSNKQVIENDDSYSNCSEIKDFLENHNWQKHRNNRYSTINYYSIDNCSLKSFGNFLNKKKCEISSVDELRRLFGDETYIKIPKERYLQEVDSLVTQFYFYKIVGNSSIELYEQVCLEYSFKEKNGEIEFNPAYMLEELEESDH